MAEHCTTKVFKVFKVLVIFVHGFQLVCNHPLLTENSNIFPPFHHSEEPYSLIPNEGWRSRSHPISDSGSSSDTFNGENISDRDYRNKPENRESSEHEVSESHRRSHHRRRSTGDIGSLCSIFQTFLFLDARSADCRVTNQQQENRRHDDSNDSNDLSLSRDPNSPGEEEMILHHERQPPPPPPPPPNNADKRIDHDINSDEEDEQDETKISQDRTMIVVPDRPCGPGKRRDPRGYCRRVVTIRTNYPFGPPQGFRPIRYYYSRFVAVPTLHFILPNLK